MFKIKLKDFLMMHVGIVLIACSTHFFLVPNHFVTGGMTGLSTILGNVATFLSVSEWLIILNIFMLIIGFIFLGKQIGFFTAYCSIGYSLLMKLLDFVLPCDTPLTEEPFMELCVGILIYAFGTAVIFYSGASSGGMDIVALILQKYAKIDVGKAVLMANSLIAVGSIFAFPGEITRAILSLAGLFANAFIIDSVIDNLGACKYFMVITDKPELVAEYIMNTLHHGVTTTEAIGAYTQTKKGMVHTVCRRYEAIKLREKIKSTDPDSFIVITTSSEIIGKGFRSV